MGFFGSTTYFYKKVKYKYEGWSRPWYKLLGYENGKVLLASRDEIIEISIKNFNRVFKIEE